MVAETEVELARRFTDGEQGEMPKPAEFLDGIERRARSDKRARNRHLRQQRGAKESTDAATAVSDPAPIRLREWTEPVDVDDIDWNSPEYDIVSFKEIPS